MSLITRCPACTTLFKVVPDQLRISGGWVRCGHCSEVFDAAAHMLSPDAVAPPRPAPTAEALPPPSPPPVPQTPAPPPEPPASSPSPPPAFAAGPAMAPVAMRLPVAPPADRAAAEPFAAHPAPVRFDARPSAAPWNLPAPDAAAPVVAPPQPPLVGEETPALPPPLPPAAPAPAHEAPWTASELQAWRALSAPPGAAGSAGSPDAPAPLQSPEAPDAAPEATPAPADAPRLLAEHQTADAAPPVDVLLARPSPGAEALEREVPLAADVDFVLSGVGDVAYAPAAEVEPEPPSVPQPAPLFVEQARRRAVWSSRPVRLALWAAAAVLALALCLQWVMSRRDWLAAREPALAPALQAACQVLGCELAPYRQLDSIVIDSSSFNRVSANAFRFSITLRNTADMPVATPALELTLTDAQERPLVRRVLSAAELGAPPALSARGEFNGAHALSVGNDSHPSAIVGYRLMAFYP